MKEEERSNSQPKKIPLDKGESLKRGLLYLQEAKNKASKSRCNSISVEEEKMYSLPQKTPKYHYYLSETRATKNKMEHRSLKT
jgi:hypothetical protein